VEIRVALEHSRGILRNQLTDTLRNSLDKKKSRLEL
jgi:hypothetical protein